MSKTTNMTKQLRELNLHESLRDSKGASDANTFGYLLNQKPGVIPSKV